MEQFYNTKMKELGFDQLVCDIFGNWEDVKDELLIPERKSGSGNGTIHVFLGAADADLRKEFPTYYDAVKTETDASNGAIVVTHYFLHSNIISMLGHVCQYDYAKEQDFTPQISECLQYLSTASTIDGMLSTTSLFKLSIGSSKLRPYFKQFESTGVFTKLIRKVLLPNSAYKISLYKNSSNQYAALWLIGFDDTTDFEIDSDSKQISPKLEFSNNLSHQIIFYGAPGTGKSNKIEEATNDDNRIRTTFHPDSDYSTFVGAYKPTMQNEDKYLERLCDINYLASLFKEDYYKADKKTVAVDTFAIKYAEYLDGKYGKVSLRELCEKAEIPTGYEVAIRDTVNAYHACVKQQIKPNQIAYTFVPQAFLKAYVEAWKRNDKGDHTPYYLVIEEINRGNCAQIFGDLFQLLDRNDEGYSRYAIAPDDDIRRHLEKELANCPNLPEKIMKGVEMRLPKNLYIWATMNTSDQSLFPIDSAFKRRWDWEYMPIENGNKGFVVDIAGTKYDWWDFISTINAKIDRMTGSEDKKLGYWFAKPAGNSTTIDCQTFVSKVLFYLWNDVYKDYADSKDSIFRANDNGQSVKTPFTTFFGTGRADRVKAFMAFNGIEPKAISNVNGNESQAFNDGQKASDGANNNTSESDAKHMKFWNDFINLCNSSSNTIKATHSARPQSWYDLTCFEGLSTSAVISLTQNNVNNDLKVQLWLSDSIGNEIYKYLHDERGEEIKESLPNAEWRSGNKGHNMLTYANKEFNLTDAESYNNALQWMVKTAERFYEVINPMINDFRNK